MHVAINVSVCVHYDGGSLDDIIPYYSSVSILGDFIVYSILHWIPISQYLNPIPTSQNITELVSHMQVQYAILPLLWCTCMAISLSVQYKGGFLPDILVLTLLRNHYWGIPMTQLNPMKIYVLAAYVST